MSDSLSERLRDMARGDPAPFPMCGALCYEAADALDKAEAESARLREQLEEAQREQLAAGHKRQRDAARKQASILLTLASQRRDEVDILKVQLSDARAALATMVAEYHALLGEPAYAGTRADWQARAMAAEAALATARNLLEMVQWSAHVWNETDSDANRRYLAAGCPVCHRLKSSGHDPQCSLRAALASPRSGARKPDASIGEE